MQEEQSAGYSIKAGYSAGGTCQASMDEAAVIAALASSEGLLWAHVRAYDIPKTFALLTDRFGFSPLAAEDALSPMERPGLQEGEGTLFLVATWPYLNDSLSSVEVGFFVGQNFVVTVANDDVPLLDAWVQRWCRSLALTVPNSAMLLHSLLDAIVDDYFPIADELEDQMDALEERIYSGRGSIVAEALRVKRNLLQLRRQITPLRDVLNGLMRRDVEFVQNEVKPHFQDIFDHTIRITETIDISRDILGSIIDAHLSLTSNKLNEVMRFMTVISTILMSMGLVAGIYGMNFRFMPELNWAAGYPFAIALMVAVAVAEYVVFRRMGWLTTRAIERSFRTRDDD